MQNGNARLVVLAIATLLYSSAYAQMYFATKITGEYIYTDSAFNTGLHSRLNLFENGSYKYETGTHMQVYHSDGTWKLKGDTVVLNSSIDAENIPISIKEKQVDSLKDHLTFDLVKNLDGEIMGAVLQFNKDTSVSCDPLIENGCVKKVGEVNSVKVQLTTEASSKWFPLKNKKANWIEVTAEVHDLLGLYLFTKNDKYLFKDGALHYIVNSKTSEDKGEVLKRMRSGKK